VHRLVLVPAERVPRQVQCPLHRLGVRCREPAAGLHDRPDQAGPRHRPACHPPQVLRGDDVLLPEPVAVGEPAVLDPTGADDGAGAGEELLDVVELGQVRDTAVLFGRAPLFPPALPPPASPSRDVDLR
jgi:hypothetical protein